MGKENRLRRNKHDFLLKLKTCQVCGARCLIIVHGEFENRGKIMHRGKSAGSGKPGRSSEGPGAGHYRRRRWTVSDQNSIWKLQGKVRWRESWCGAPSLKVTPLPAAPGAQQSAGRDAFPSGQDKGGWAARRSTVTSLVLPVCRSSLSPRALSAGIRLWLCYSFSSPQ